PVSDLYCIRACFLHCLQSFTTKDEHSGSVPKLQTCTASERAFLIIYSPSLRGEVSESVPRFQTHTASEHAFFIVYRNPLERLDETAFFPYL
ncbi:hypothetical protein, partial [Oribacterium sinus]|uniref:hypothetical protein n=1 Tax=Oribacterium sinus TaxID=237576 RepID=UPI0028E896BF